MSERKIAAMWKCPREDFDRFLAERGVAESQTGWSLVRAYDEYELRLRDLASSAKSRGAAEVYAITWPLDDWRALLRDKGVADTPDNWGQLAIDLLTPRLRLGAKITEKAVGWALVDAADLSPENACVERLA